MADHVVIVTGGGRGIGRAICERFAAGRSQVVAAARSQDELAQTRAIIEERGGLCHVVPTDICQPEAIIDLVKSTVEKFGGVQVLVNNAGVAPLSKLEDLDPALFEAIQAVNIDAVYHTCRAVWPVMTSQKDGVIVNISSLASLDPFPGLAAYGAAKAWVNAWTKGLADEGRPHGIRVFSVAPGAVETKMLRNAFPDFPAGQAMSPADVAGVVWSLSQPECRMATGQTVCLKK
jgi:3-oxoacyl-[acyl-carrier protein] reductase